MNLLANDPEKGTGSYHALRSELSERYTEIDIKFYTSAYEILRTFRNYRDKVSLEIEEFMNFSFICTLFPCSQFSRLIDDRITATTAFQGCQDKNALYKNFAIL